MFADITQCCNKVATCTDALLLLIAQHGVSLRFVWQKNIYHSKENLVRYHKYTGVRGGAVVEALRYKTEGRGIDSRWCHWNFSFT
jgi:hypothetical protein